MDLKALEEHYQKEKWHLGYAEQHYRDECLHCTVPFSEFHVGAVLLQ